MFKAKFRNIGLFSILFLLVLALAGCGSSNGGGEANKDNGKSSSSDKPINLKLAYTLPETHHLGVGMIRFADEVKKKTNGRVTVQLFPNSQLYRDVDIPQAVINGSVDLGLTSSEQWASIAPSMDWVGVPFLFTSMPSLVKAFEEGGISAILESELEKKGAKLLIWGQYGPTNFANSKRLIKQPEDLQGLKIRGRGRLSEETIKALGGIPTAISSSELYEALQRGTADGVSTGTTSMVSRKLFEVQKYLTMTNDNMSQFPLVMNLKVWNDLPKDVQDVLLQVSADVTKSIREDATKAEQDAIQTLKSNKMEVYTVKPEEVPKWRETVQPVWEMYIKQAGESGQKIIDIAKKYQS